MKLTNRVVSGLSANDPIADDTAIDHLGRMSDNCCSSKSVELEKLARQADQRRVLIAALVINAVMFFVEFGAGIVAGSAALMADATDMLGDALVYGVSLFALSRGDQWKAGAAAFKGVLILLLGIGILVNVALKIVTGVPPSSTLMLVFGGLPGLNLDLPLTALALPAAGYKHGKHVRMFTK